MNRHLKFNVLTLCGIALLLSFPLSCSSDTSGAPLWENLTAGMTPAQVLKTIQGSREEPNRNELRKGNICQVWLPEFKDFDSRFIAAFGFREDRLVQIELFLKKDYPGLRAFQELAPKLENRYGPASTSNFAGLTPERLKARDLELVVEWQLANRHIYCTYRRMDDSVTVDYVTLETITD